MDIQKFFRTIIKKGYMKIEGNKWQIEASAKSLLEVAELLGFEGEFPSLVRQLNYYNFGKARIEEESQCRSSSKPTSNLLKFTHRSEIPLEHRKDKDNERALGVLIKIDHSKELKLAQKELKLAQAEIQRLADANRALTSELEYEKNAHRNLRAKYHSLHERYSALLSERPSSMRTDSLQVSGVVSADRSFLTDGDDEDNPFDDNLLDDNLLFDKVFGPELLFPGVFAPLTPVATNEDAEAPSAFKDDTPLPKRTDRKSYSFFGKTVIESTPPEQSEAIKKRRTAAV